MENIKNLQFVNDVKTKGNQWVRAVEILPAAETLFLQYLTLDNEEAKEFILENNIQISKSLYFNNSWPVVNQQLSNGKVCMLFFLFFEVENFK